MEKISLGPDELDDYDFESLNNNRPLDLSINKIIYYYKHESYEGEGLAIYLDSNGYWHYDEIGHCSCYGPFAEGFNKITYDYDEIIKLLERDIYDLYNRECAKPIYSYLKLNKTKEN